MADITFVTGNQSKADYLAKYLGYPIAHHKVDLDELQSLDLAQIVEHKVKQAYGVLKTPVIVEDVSLEFSALGHLPGPFIKFFVEELEDEAICRLLDGKDRSATARCMFGYYDGHNLKLLEGKITGMIAEHPTGDGGYGWDRVFIPDGYSVTRAELSEDDYQKVYLQIKPFEQLKRFLVTLADSSPAS